MRSLKTERLLLEPLREAHAAEMFRVLVDPIIYTFLNERPPFTVEELRARYRFLEKGRSPDGRNDWFSWLIRDASGDGLGFVQAEVYPRHAADLSVVLAPRAWRKGYAREALGAVIHDLGTHGEVVSFYATVSPRNEAAVNILEALRFRPQSRGEFDVRPVDVGELIYVLEKA